MESRVSTLGAGRQDVFLVELPWVENSTTTLTAQVTALSGQPAGVMATVTPADAVVPHVPGQPADVPAVPVRSKQ
jgi:hypothetical protein